MSNILFPTFDVPYVPEKETDNPQKYRPAPLFDIEKGDFVYNGAKQVVYGNGYDAWVLWCTKTILTQRSAFMAYANYIGIEREEAFKEPDRAAVQSTFERTITEALLADPLKRTEYVRDFEFEWVADSLYISCLCIGADGNSAAIKARL